MNNADQTEIEKFNRLAHQWWDPNGQCKPLHQINPIRLQWIQSIAPLKNQIVLDIGCGGGILTESMSQCAAQVTGIDLSKEALEIAELHSLDSGLKIEYRLTSAEALAEQQPQQYDIVTCMEMLEHVPDPAQVIKAAVRLLKPNGYLFLSTINRNLKAYAISIIGAEYIAKILPKGTHDYHRFIRPAELARLIRAEQLHLLDLAGISYHLLSQTFSLTQNTDVNYLMACQKTAS